nr:MAG TPA: hypothetical protein [Caudoviricetes sp.]
MCVWLLKPQLVPAAGQLCSVGLTSAFFSMIISSTPTTSFT